jgi:CHRD domain
MNRFVRTLVVAVALLTLIVPATGSAQNDRQLRTDLSGFNEVHAPSLSAAGVFNAGNGSIFSTGGGRVELKVDKQNRQIKYELSYAFPDAARTPVVGTQFVNQAHLHFGQKHTTGGIPVWLCQSADNAAPPAAADTPICPSPSGTVNGTITPAKVLALGGQGFPSGEEGFDALLEALQNGNIYANVHTDRFPPGEIRGHLNDHDHNN